MENESNTGGNFVKRFLPWLVGGAALVFYLTTLNHWISYLNMTQVARISGYVWQPELFSPLYALVTWPLRWLPQSWVPVAANVFSAVCAALTLMLLARAVALLPHDRTNAQRERETSEDSLLNVPLSWLPPLFAVLACGLQLTFWEHGTNGTPDMVNLLGFAYVIRAFLEYRLEERESWLYKAALVYGALMTSDWFMITLFPAFLVAIVWLRGLKIFNLQFLGRMALLGLVGISLYLFLPVIASLTSPEPLNFWQALKINLVEEKKFVLNFPRKTLALMALTSLLPVLVLSVRSAARSTDTSLLGIWMARFVSHVVQALFFIVGLWIMLDPRVSPRQSGLGVPFLSLYFLTALSLGYFSGYFLLVFRPVFVRGRRLDQLPGWLYRAATVAVVLLAVATPAVLVIKNWPMIRDTNHHSALTEFGRVMGGQLPKSGCLLTDDPRRMLLARAWLARTGREQDLLVAEGLPLALGVPGYHRYLQKQYGAKWPVTVEAKRTAPFDLGMTLAVLNRFAQTSGLYYLHPSFGGFFENFYLEPKGLVCKLNPYATNALVPPPCAPQTLAENEAFWDQAARDVFPEVLAALAPRDPDKPLTFRDQLLARLRVPKETSTEARVAGSMYSRSLDYWAVELQKAGEFEKAAGRFDLAQKLNPENVVAQINLDYNKKFRAGQRPRLEKGKAVEDRFGKADSWDQVLNQNGPFDEPTLCFAEGKTMLGKRLYRQSAQAFERVHALVPEDADTRIYLGELNLLARKHDRALELARGIVEQPDSSLISTTNRADALSLEARIHFARDEPERADALLAAAMDASPTDDYLLACGVVLYTQQARYTNALAIVERQMKLHPDDPAALLNKGFLNIQLNAFDEAIRAMTQLLNVQTNRPEALLNRAIAYLRTDQLDLAEKDYETLLGIYPNARQVNFGLGEIAFRRKDTDLAMRRYEAYLSNAVPGATETKFVENRLKELRGAKPQKL